MKKKKNKGGRPTIYTQKLGKDERVIYFLFDEIGIKYIGQTNNLQKRYGQHCSLAQNRGYSILNKWLYGLLKRGIFPKMKIIEITKNANKRERYWITFYKNRGVNLLNMTKGGNDIDFVNKAKEKMPWFGRHSPVQRRLKSISETINFFRRRERFDIVSLWENRLNYINDFLRHFGLKKANYILFNKYGE